MLPNPIKVTYSDDGYPSCLFSNVSDSIIQQYIQRLLSEGYVADTQNANRYISSNITISIEFLPNGQVSVTSGPTLPF
ncbi:hypothetical protein FACS1894188_09500 [Clostridia bacterium]|nr:hypothetical protein FACS1894188_09500 [Clostridia bacterium]